MLAWRDLSGPGHSVGGRVRRPSPAPGATLWLGPEFPGLEGDPVAPPRAADRGQCESPLSSTPPCSGGLGQHEPFSTLSQLVAMNTDLSGRVPGNWGVVFFGGHPPELLPVFVFHGSFLVPCRKPVDRELALLEVGEDQLLT